MLNKVKVDCGPYHQKHKSPSADGVLRVTLRWVEKFNRLVSAQRNIFLLMQQELTAGLEASHSKIGSQIHNLSIFLIQTLRILKLGG